MGESVKKGKFLMKIFLLIILNQVLMRNKRTGDYILYLIEEVLSKGVT